MANVSPSRHCEEEPKQTRKWIPRLRSEQAPQSPGMLHHRDFHARQSPPKADRVAVWRPSARNDKEKEAHHDKEGGDVLLMYWTRIIPCAIMKGLGIIRYNRVISEQYSAIFRRNGICGLDRALY